MYKFKFDITKEDIDKHVKNNFSEREREAFKNVKFVPCDVRCNDDMDIEVTVVGALDTDANTDTENSEKQE